MSVALTTSISERTSHKSSLLIFHKSNQNNTERVWSAKKDC